MMDRQKFLEQAEDIFGDCLELMEKKNKDYATNANPWGNISAVEKSGIVKTEIGLLVRMQDKWSRLTNLIHRGSIGTVKDETIEDTIKDMINYLVLLLLGLRHEKQEKAKEESKCQK